MAGLSRTAAYVAAGRAIGAREPDPDVNNPDYLAERLLGDPSRFDLRLPLIDALGRSYDEAMDDIEIASIVRAMIVRTRFIDEALLRALASGIGQVLILGAGFDSHAYRYEPLLKGLTVFEVDRPEMQAYKRERVRHVVGKPPPNLKYVPLDFESQTLREVLVDGGYDFSVRSFVIMEGVTMYLTEEALRETLTLLASHPARSGVVFDFVSSVVIDSLRALDIMKMPTAARPYVERFLHLLRDEPWLFGFPLHGERDYIEAFGFEVPEILTIGGPESVRRYLTRADGSEVGDETISKIPKPQTEVARRQADAQAYRIVEAIVARRH
jgi:methyltransferase (TIGR00027 family)